MKKVKMIVNTDGSVEVDMVEGFSGTSCEAKAKGLEVLIAGATNSTTKQKPEYFESNGDEMIDIFTGR